MSQTAEKKEVNTESKRYLTPDIFLYTSEAGGLTFLRYFNFVTHKDLLLLTIHHTSIVVNPKQQSLVEVLQPDIESFLNIKF